MHNIMMFVGLIKEISKMRNMYYKYFFLLYYIMLDRKFELK